jgi:hypothetical protein
MLGWAEVELSSWMIVNKLRLLWSSSLPCAQTRSKFLKPLAEMYAWLDPDLRRAIGAHDFPARPIHIVISGGGLAGRSIISLAAAFPCCGSDPSYAHGRVAFWLG